MFDDPAEGEGGGCSASRCLSGGGAPGDENDGEPGPSNARSMEEGGTPRGIARASMRFFLYEPAFFNGINANTVAKIINEYAEAAGGSVRSKTTTGEMWTNKSEGLALRISEGHGGIWLYAENVTKGVKGSGRFIAPPGELTGPYKR